MEFILNIILGSLMAIYPLLVAITGLLLLIVIAVLILD